MARELTQRYSQIPPLTTPLDDKGYIPIAQGVVPERTVYRVPPSRIYSYLMAKVGESNVLKDGISVGIGITKDPETGALGLDREYLDSISIPIDILDITIVGDCNYGKFDLIVNKQTNEITFVKDVYVLLDHKRGKIAAGTVVKVTPNTTGYIYLSVNTAGVLSVTYRTNKLAETLSSTVMMEIVSAGGDITYRGKPYSRLGLYRISRTPTGTSASGSTGSAAANPTAFWLKEQY